METLPNSIEEVTIEATEESVTYEEELQYQEEETLEAQEYIKEISEELSEMADTIIPYSPNRAAPNRVQFNDSECIYTLKMNNTEYRVLFPEDALLEVVDGVLINRGSSNVTGVCLATDDYLSVTSYSQYFVTIVPSTSTSGNTSIYRYGSNCYITYYYPGTNNNLLSTTTYSVPEVVAAPKLWSKLNFPTSAILLCCVILVVIEFFKGIFSR